MNDWQLYHLRHTLYSNIKSDADVARTIATAYGYTESGVRGQLSRANTPENQARLIQELADYTPDVAPSVERQLRVIEKSNKIWNKWKGSSSDFRAVFLSDIHFPKPRFDAYALAMQIINDLKPDIVTGANDAVDNTGFGRWGDERPVRGQVYSSDRANLLRMELAHYRNLSSDMRLVVQIAGNHDLWYYRNLREMQPKTAEMQIADYMEALYDAGMLQFSRGYDENYLELGKGLVFWHGQFTDKSPQMMARKSIEHFAHVFNDGIMRSVVVGHTHRPMAVDGSSVGYPSVQFVNSGALTDYAPYLGRHPHGHGLGMVFADFNFQQWEHEVHLIQFLPKGNKLRAQFRGVNYEVELNTRHTEDYL